MRVLPAVSSVAAAVALAAGLSVPATAAPTGGGAFVVELTDPPLAAYDGGTQGIPATSPKASGAKLDARSTAARRYRTYLDGRQDAVLRDVPGRAPELLYEYRTALAGFAASLTGAQADALRDQAGVLAVTPATNDRLDAADDVIGGTDTAAPWLGGDGAAWLRLTAPDGNGVTARRGGGLWSRTGGPEAATGPGAGMVLGDLDSGLTSRPNASFAATAAGGYVGVPFGAAPTSWKGTCAGTGIPCTSKVVGARAYSAGLQAVTTLGADETAGSAVDHDGHGSHTAGTAVGNYGVSPSAGANGTRISGIAPRAQLAVYKTCWHTTANATSGVCNSADVIAAIDQSLVDGVDVLTHSIGGGNAQGSPKQRAFLRAYDAGVFVAASAGNDGPTASTYGATPSPWTTVVAASTLNRTFPAKLTLTRTGVADVVVDGLSLSGGLPAAAKLIEAKDIPASANTRDANICLANAVSGSGAAGKVVVCERGTNSLVDKANEVKRAGGVGMVLGNISSAQNQLATVYPIPTVHLDATGLATVRSANADAKANVNGINYLMAQVSNARRTAAVPTDGATPRIARFSSRGPVATALDLPGPDVTAPGVEVLAASDGTPSDFLFMEGTSMSTPHVAGAALLLQQRHPAWAPEAIKSALSTTADPQVKTETGDTLAGPQLVGSGQIDPTSADAPGLVLIPTRASLAAYQDDAAVAGALNLPQAISWSMGGSHRWTRRFTATDTAAHTWTVSGTAPAGMSLTTSPAVGTSVTVQPCGTLDLAITVVRGTTSQDNVAGTGSVTLTDETGRRVQVPITARPTRMGAPATAIVRAAPAAGVAGTRTFEVSPGAAGPFSARLRGLAAPTTTAHAIPKATSTTASADTNALRIPVDVPAGTPTVLALTTASAPGTVAGDDVDAFLYLRTSAGAPTGTALGSSAADGVDERVVVTRPAATTDTAYVWVVTAYAAPDGVADATVSRWNTATDPSVDGATLAGSTSVPAATPADRFALTLRTGALPAAQQRFGLVAYYASADATGTPVGLSAVEVRRDAATSAPAERSAAGCAPPAALPVDPEPAPEPVPTPEPDPGTGAGTGTTTDPGTTVPPATTTTDAAPGTPSPVTDAPAPVATTPTGSPTPAGPQTKAAPRLTVGKLTVKGRTLKVALTGSEPVSVSVAIFRGKASKAASTAKATAATTKQRTATLKLTRKLRRGSYRVVLTAKAPDGRTTTVTRTVRVR